jgi:DNA-binding SARP family transcriptional activator
MLVRVLGSIEAIGEGDGDRDIALGGAIQRRIMAILALEAGEVVSLDRLVEISWPEGEAPAQAERNVRTYVHRLRAALGSDLADRIETIAPGYRLHLGSGELDAEHFDQLAARAARLAGNGDPAGAPEAIEEADRLWQGRPFGEFADEQWALAEVGRLDEMRLGLRELEAEMLVEVGRFGEAVSDLEELTRVAPLRERPRGLLMRALHQSGRRVEALRAFQEFRALLVEEVGVEPSAELVELDRAIASGEASRRAAGSSTRKVGAYELHELIGEGAFALVYRGVQTGLDRPVAIKAIPQSRQFHGGMVGRW